jgi:hypothetical protein
MKISDKTGILKIYLGEMDKIHGRLVYEEIIFMARKVGMAGATAYKGIMSFGASHSVHTMKIFALSSDMPVIVEIVDTMEKINGFIPEINRILDESKKGGLMTCQEIDVIRYLRGEKYNQGI